MDHALLVSAAYVVLCHKKKKNRTWIRSFLNKRETVRSLSSELILDNYLFQNFSRMTKSDFDYLLNQIGPNIAKRDTVMRKAIPINTRLAITLRFLATGDSYKSLMYLFRVSDCSISRIVPEVCEALIQALKETIKMPKSDGEWKAIAKEFEDRWNFPHCVGAMDGKHIAIVCPPNSGSKYFNYKQFFSVVLFAVVDANYKFLYVHVGCQGRISDGGVFRNTAFGKSLLENKLKLPLPEPLPGREKPTPYVFVADDAFPLVENINKPYIKNLQQGSPQRIYNYRLSRARRIVENVFGISASVFRVLHTTMDIKLEHVRKVVLTCTYLHNFLMSRKTSVYNPPGTFDFEDIDTGIISDGSWRSDDSSLTALHRTGRNSGTTAKEIRDEFMQYFMTERGRVAWQDNK